MDISRPWISEFHKSSITVCETQSRFGLTVYNFFYSVNYLVFIYLSILFNPYCCSVSAQLKWTVNWLNSNILFKYLSLSTQIQTLHFLHSYWSIRNWMKCFTENVKYVSCLLMKVSLYATTNWFQVQMGNTCFLYAHLVKAIIWKKCMSLTSIVVSGWAPSMHMQSNRACSFGHVSVAQEVECWTLHLVGSVAITTGV